MYRTLTAVLVVGTAAVAACTPTATDFQKEAEKNIASAKFADAYAVQNGGTRVEFTNVACETPATVEVGSAFTCQATGDDGQNYSFTVSVPEKNKFSITSVTKVGPAGG